MASIETRILRDGTATHRVRFRRGGRGTPQESVTFETYAAAEAFKSNMDRFGVEVALEILDAGATAVAPATLAEWASDYVEHKAGITEGTRIRYRGIVARDLGKMGALPLTAVTERAVATWILTQQAEGASAKTIANKHGLLYAVMEKARDKGLITANPCAETELPETANETERVFLTHDEFARLIAHVRPDAQDLVIALVGTGHRFGEATALQVRDWDSGNRRVTISRAWKYSGQSSKPVLGAPKTRRSKRSHTVSPQVAEIYDRLTEGRGGNEFIFTNARGNPWTASAFHSSVWQPAVECANGGDWQAKRAKWEPSRAAKVGGRRKPWLVPAKVPLGKRPRIHDLRHTAASWWLAAGVPVINVSRRLGHESIKTTVDVYGHLSPEQDAAMDAAMEIALSPAVPQIEA